MPSRPCSPRSPAAAPRGPLPLAFVERAAVVASMLPEAALGAAARAIALAPPLDTAEPVRSRPLPDAADPRTLADDLGASLLAFDLRLEEDPRLDASLLGVAESLVYLHAAAWSGEAARARSRGLAGGRRSTLARRLLGGGGDARSRRSRPGGDRSRAVAARGDGLPGRNRAALSSAAVPRWPAWHGCWRRPAASASWRATWSPSACARPET